MSHVLLQTVSQVSFHPEPYQSLTTACRARRHRVALIPGETSLGMPAQGRDRLHQLHWVLPNLQTLQGRTHSRSSEMAVLTMPGKSG